MKNMKNTEFRALSAMVRAGLKRKPKLNPVQHARRVAIEAELQQRRYCNAFALWRTCRRKALPETAHLRRRCVSVPATRARWRAAGGCSRRRVRTSSRRRRTISALRNARREGACRAIFMSRQPCKLLRFTDGWRRDLKRKPSLYQRGQITLSPVILRREPTPVGEPRRMSGPTAPRPHPSRAALRAAASG